MPINIAIVEDDADICQSLEEIINANDDLHCVAVFSSAEEFISTFRHINVQVVLMDINLPGKDGIATVAEMKPVKPAVQYLMCTV
ncbi:MAG TPA: response regulator, partial [Parafilimonas sp.]|nr:response regulator [Parafilimonas sp.]